MTRTSRYIFLAFAAFISILFISNYEGRSDYLLQSSADKVWQDFLSKTGKIIKKGDYLHYKALDEDGTPDTLAYSARISDNVDSLNEHNAPVMRKVYLLEGRFQSASNKATLSLYEKRTGILIESLDLRISKIDVKSIIPALLAIILCIASMKPVLSITIALVFGSVLNNSYSVFSGIGQLVLNYIPAGIIGENYANLKIILTLFLIHICMGLLSFSGMGKSPEGKLKGFLSPLFGLHPYISSSMGSWWMNTHFCNSATSKRTFFWNHPINLIVPSLVLSPVLINIFLADSSSNNLMSGFISLTAHRFFSISLLCLMFLHIVYKRNYWQGDYIRESKPLIYEHKKWVKKNKSLPYITLILLPLLSYVFSIFIKDINSLILCVSFSMFVVLSLFCYLRFLLSVSDVLNIIIKSFKQVSYYLIMLVLSFSMLKLLSDTGAAFYIIGFFREGLTSPAMPFAVFLISATLTILIGSGLSSVMLLLPVLIPIVSQTGAGSGEVLVVLAMVIEGGILGELICPYSTTAIITASTSRNTPVHITVRQLPYTLTAFLLSCVIGLLMLTSGAPLWSISATILFFSLILMSKKP